MTSEYGRSRSSRSRKKGEERKIAGEKRNPVASEIDRTYASITAHLGSGDEEEISLPGLVEEGHLARGGVVASNDEWKNAQTRQAWSHLEHLTVKERKVERIASTSSAKKSKDRGQGGAN